MPGTELKIKNDNPYDVLLIAEGGELKVGVRVYNGARKTLVNGVETEVAEPVWGGTYRLESGQVVEVVDGVVVEIKDAVEVPLPEGIKAEAQKRKLAYKKK